MGIGRRFATVHYAAALLFLAFFSIFISSGVSAQGICLLPSGVPYKSSDSPAVYLIDEDCKKQAFKNEQVFFSYFDSWDDVQTIDAAGLENTADHELDFIPYGPKRHFNTGSLIKTVDNPTVYVKVLNSIHPITTERAFRQMGLDFAWIEDVSPAVLEPLVVAPQIDGPQDYPERMAFTYPDSPRVYFVEDTASSEKAKAHIETFSVLALNYRIDRLPVLERDIIFPNIEGSTPDPYEELAGVTRFISRDGREAADLANAQTATSTPVEEEETTSPVAYYYGGGGGGGGSSSSATTVTVPSAPLSLAATVSTTEMILNWSTPSTNGGASITDYRIEFKNVASTTYTVLDDGTSTNLTATVTNTVDGVGYDFRVYAQNSAGYSSASSVVTATSSDYAGQTTGLTLTPSSTEIIATWTAPASNGGTPVSDYIIQYTTDGTTFTTSSDGTGTATGTTITGLTNGTAYGVRVTATNDRGNSPSYSSVATTTPSSTPAQVTGVGTTIGDAQVALTWSVPSDNGNTITDYIVTYKRSASSSYTTFIDGTSTNATATVDGLVNGIAYDFQIAAVNGVGPGVSSTAVSATPLTTPNEPTSVTTTASSTELIVTWIAPTSTGGSAITDYTIEYSSDGTNFTTFIDGTSTATGTTINSLTNGTAYGVRVSAVNSIGTGTTSTVTTNTPGAVPDAPVLSSVASSTEVILTWTVPANNGFAITDYGVEYKLTASSTYTAFADGVSTATGTTVTTLTNGSGYDFRVTAVNSFGTSTESNIVGNTPSTTPDLPTSVTLTASSTELIVVWTPPASDGGASITDYVVEHSTDGINFTTFADGTSTATGTTITSLTNGTAYGVRVAALNAVGNGPSSTVVTSTPGAVPDAPTLSATASSTEVILTWTVPNNNGSAITDYDVLYKLTPSSTYTTFVDGVSTATGTTVTSLTNGSSYDFTVGAVNGFGTSSPSSVQTVTPAAVPGAPTGLTLTSSTASMGLSWTAPASNGGSAITDYLIEYRPATNSIFVVFTDGVSTAVTANVTNLTNGIEYGFRVSAINAFGTSTATAISSSTPFTVPAAPVSVSGTPATSSVALVWLASSTNGAVITDYVIGYKLTSDSNFTTTSDGVSAATSAFVTGLTPSSSYDFRIAAVNAAGTSTESVVYTTTTLPTTSIVTAAAPTSLTASTTAEGTVLLSWFAPTNTGGGTISDYQVESKLTPTGTTYGVLGFVGSAATSTSVTVSIGSSAYHDFRVTAVNEAGTSTNYSNEATSTIAIFLQPHSNTGGACPTSVIADLHSVSSTGGTISIDMDSTAFYTAALGRQRRFEMIVPANVNTLSARPVIFGWHGGGEDASAIIGQGMTDATATTTGPGPAISVAPEDINYATSSIEPDLVYDWAHFEQNNAVAGGPNTAVDLTVSSTNPDLLFFDDILLCLHEAYNVDLDRVYSIGHSAGAFMTAMLGMYRSDRVAAIYSGSGGLPSPSTASAIAPSYVTSTYYTAPFLRPSMIEFGRLGGNNGAGDEIGLTDTFGQNYHLVSSSVVLSDQLMADNRLVVECQGDQNHTPPDPPTQVISLYWPFFSHHPRWVTSSAQFNGTASFPSDFNSFNQYTGASAGNPAQMDCQVGPRNFFINNDETTTSTISRPWQ